MTSKAYENALTTFDETANEYRRQEDYHSKILLSQNKKKPLMYKVVKSKNLKVHCQVKTTHYVWQ